MLYKQKRQYASNKYTAQFTNPKWAHSCDHQPSQNINITSTAWAPFLPPPVTSPVYPKTTAILTCNIIDYFAWFWIYISSSMWLYVAVCHSFNCWIIFSYCWALGLFPVWALGIFLLWTILLMSLVSICTVGYISSSWITGVIQQCYMMPNRFQRNYKSSPFASNVGVPIVPHSCSYVVFSIFLILAILVSLFYFFCEFNLYFLDY